MVAVQLGFFIPELLVTQKHNARVCIFLSKLTKAVKHATLNPEVEILLGGAHEPWTLLFEWTPNVFYFQALEPEIFSLPLSTW